MNAHRLIPLLVLALIWTFSFSPWPCLNALAAEPMRIWVDQSGRFSVEARLIDITDQELVLLPATGKTVRIRRDRISDRDAAYLKQVEKTIALAPNILRSEPPQLPPIAPRPIFNLPNARVRADENEPLIMARATTRPRTQLPESMLPDASPVTIDFAPASYPIDRIDSYDVVSPALTIAGSSSSETTPGKPWLAVSITTGLRLPSQNVHGRILRFDAGVSSPTTVWEGNEAIRIFDHHHPSGRWLMLVGQSSLGHGGQLVLAGGRELSPRSRGGRLEFLCRRGLPAPESVGRLHIVRWANLIDEEHAFVLLDRSLILWNLVSGEQIFRIDGMVDKAIPAVSAGKRYLAVPGTGTVDLYSTQDGEPLGRIAVESNSVPGVSFSPRGDALAIATTKRLRVWDITAAALRGDVTTKQNLGVEPPIWVTDDLVLSGTGVMISLFRGVPIWHYQLAGGTASAVGNRVAVLRMYPESDLSVLTLPHPGARAAIRWIDTNFQGAEQQSWRLPGRSVWNGGQWQDRDVQVSSLGTSYR